MITKLNHSLILFLISILGSSHGYSMFEEKVDLSVSPSYRFLLIKYNYSDEFIKHLGSSKKNTNYDPFQFKQKKSSESLEVQEWRAKRDARYEEYKRAYKDYTRANKALRDKDNPTAESLERLNRKKKAFQLAVGTVLRRHGSIAAIEMVQKIKEEMEKNPTEEAVDEELINTDLHKHFEEQIKAIEELIFSPPSKLKVVATLPETVDAFALDGTDIKFSVQQLKKIISQLSREVQILDDVILYYNRDYLPEVSNGWSIQQWQNWLTVEKEHEVKRDIKKHIEEKYPRGEYTLKLMGKDPTLEDLQQITSRQVGVYYKNKGLFCKTKDKEEIEIKQADKTTPSSLGAKVFSQFQAALESAERSEPLTIEDQWCMLNFLSICGYLPDDYSVEHMSRLKQDREHVLATLLKPKCGWVIKGILWCKIEKEEEVQEEKREYFEISTDEDGSFSKSINQVMEECDRDGDLSPPHDTLHNVSDTLSNEDDEFKKFWQPYDIDNKVFKSLKKLNQKLKSQCPITFEPWMQEEETLTDVMPVAYEDIKSHRNKMLPAILDLKKKLSFSEKVSLKNSSKPNRAEVEEYNKLYAELEILLKKNRNQQMTLDEWYSSWTRIPTRRTFFASDVPYAELPPIPEINLRGNGLKDENFFIRKKLTFGKISDIFDEEKTTEKKPHGLLLEYKKIDLSCNSFVGLQFPKFSDNLTELNLEKNLLVHLTWAKSLPNLEILNLSHNNIKCITDLIQCTALRYLNLATNEIENIDLIGIYFTRLRDLNLSDNNIEDFHPLGTLTLLTSLTTVNCNLSGEWNNIFPLGLRNLCILDVRSNEKLNLNSPPVDKEAIKKTFPVLKKLETNHGRLTWEKDPFI